MDHDVLGNSLAASVIAVALASTLSSLLPRGWLVTSLLSLLLASSFALMVQFALAAPADETVMIGVVIPALLLPIIASLLVFRSCGWRVRRRWHDWGQPWRVPVERTSRQKWIARAWKAAVVVLPLAAAGTALYMAVIAPIHAEQRVVRAIEQAGGSVQFAHPESDFWSVEIVRRRLPMRYSEQVDEIDLKNCIVSRRLLADCVRLPLVRNLDLTDADVAADAWSAMPKHTALLNLSLGGTRIDDAGLAHVGEHINLKRLRLDRTPVTDDGLVHLAKLTSIYLLSLAETGVADAGMKHLQSLPSLTFLDLDRTNVSDVGVATLSGCPRLEQLSLADTKITDSSLKSLLASRWLESLDVSRTSITDAGLADISQIPFLRHLTLAGTAITDEGLQRLAAGPRIWRLNLNDTAITDASGPALTRVIGLLDLSVANTALTDAFLEDVAGIRVLGTLDVSNTAITDKGLAQLNGHPGLRSIDLAGTQATPEAVRELSAKAPEPQAVKGISQP
ncbi:MAG: leucine-rich repeat domain-containing protein [Pirellulales bacterium]